MPTQSSSSVASGGRSVSLWWRGRQPLGSEGMSRCRGAEHAGGTSQQEGWSRSLHGEEMFGIVAIFMRHSCHIHEFLCHLEESRMGTYFKHRGESI